MRVKETSRRTTLHAVPRNSLKPSRLPYETRPSFGGGRLVAGKWRTKTDAMLPAIGCGVNRWLAVGAEGGLVCYRLIVDLRRGRPPHACLVAPRPAALVEHRALEPGEPAAAARRRPRRRSRRRSRRASARRRAARPSEPGRPRARGPSSPPKARRARWAAERCAIRRASPAAPDREKVHAGRACALVAYRAARRPASAKTSGASARRPTSRSTETTSSRSTPPSCPATWR